MSKYKITGYLDVDESLFEGDTRYEQWKTFNFNRQMVELFGEAARLAKYVDENESEDEIEYQFNIFERLCAMSLADPKITNGEKYEVYYAYKDLKDFRFSDDPICKTKDIVMKWFNQWIEPYRMKIAFGRV